jgi:hypothetical protein
MSQQSPSVIFVYNRFSDFLAEAVYFAVEASRLPAQSEVRETLIKSSILFGVFALESAANALISPLDFSRETKRGFDRLPVIAKFQIFYMSQKAEKNLTADVQRFRQLRT